MKQKMQVYILSGFLGSGKTTVLKRIVEECKKHDKQLGIILNELGDTNVENHLFENEQMVELLNGCICCSIQDDLKLTLDQFAKNPVDTLLIEGTGVANPNEIIEALANPSYIDQFELRSIISLVDASNYLDYQSIFSSSKEIRTLLKEQITCATLIILNKTDLISDKKLEKINSQIRKLVANGVPIVHSTFGNISVDELLKKRVRTLNLSQAEQNSSCSCSSGGHDLDCSHDHDHDHVNHSKIKAVKLENLPVFEKKTFEKWLKGLPKEIFRGKGIIQFKGDHSLYSFQLASGKLFVEKVEAEMKQTPVIILIGNDLNSMNIKESYEQTFFNRL
ncbi:MAG: CobW family GTP-binding protein [Bacillota bacterium]